MRYCMGIDGGGTKTICLLSDENGNVIGKGVAGPSNYHVVGIEQTQAAIHACIREAIASSGREITEIQSITLGMAGVDRPDDYAVVNRILDALDVKFWSRTTDNDAVIALAGATVARPGVVLICGTGSIAFGINQRGERRRAGGWGPILGDEGGGYDIGRRAMIAAMRDGDGRGPSTILKPMILEHLQLPAVERLVARVHVQNMQRHEIAVLARLVIDAANKGDRVAQEILIYAGRELATGAIAVIRGLNMQLDEFEIGLAGGVFRARGLIVETISRLTREIAPQSNVVMPRFEPSVGALLLALKMNNNGLTDQTVENVAATI